MTHHDQCLAALEKTLGLLAKSNLPDADELCDEIVGLTTMPACEFEGCTSRAEVRIGSRKRHRVMACCTKHAGKVEVEGSPEYLVDCPNCGCCLGVG